MRRVALCSFVLSLGCTAEVPPTPHVGPRIAFGPDFQGFEGWRSYPLPPESLTEGHLSSLNRWIYVDREPPPEGTPFELGTIVVKTIEDGPPSSWVVHAMVKRGGGYNPSGSVDWEFFDLHLDDDHEVSIAWRGTGDDSAIYFDPTSGERLACNSCHTFGAELDYVFSRRVFDGAP